MFNSLLQGMTQQVVGVMSGQESTNTMAHFLRGLPDFTYTAGESFFIDLFMDVVYNFIFVHLKKNQKKSSSLILQCEHVTFRDLMDIFVGQWQVLNNIHEQLRGFVVRRVLAPQGTFSQESSRTGTMALVNEAMPLLASAAVFPLLTISNLIN